MSAWAGLCLRADGGTLAKAGPGLGERRGAPTNEAGCTAGAVSGGGLPGRAGETAHSLVLRGVSRHADLRRRCRCERRWHRGAPLGRSADALRRGAGELHPIGHASLDPTRVEDVARGKTTRPGEGLRVFPRRTSSADPASGRGRGQRTRLRGDLRDPLAEHGARGLAHSPAGCDGSMGGRVERPVAIGGTARRLEGYAAGPADGALRPLAHRCPDRPHRLAAPPDRRVSAAEGDRFL